MKFFKKAAALFLAAAFSLSISAFAETAESNVETSIIDIDNSPETEIIDPVDDVESQLPESGVDLSDTEYQPVDISGYTEWDGKTKMVSGVNYYISKTTKLRKNFSVPENSSLIICSGAELVIYKGFGFGVHGRLLIEPNAKLTVSGTYTEYAQASTEVYGEFAATKSSNIKILSEFIVRHGGKAVVSGTMYIYKDGMYLNYGTTSLTAASTTKITGEMQSAADGRLTIKGYIGITINGRATVAGYFSLTGEFVNSGVFIFENTAKFYKSRAAHFAVSKSSRLIDYRYGTDTKPNGDFGSTTDVGAKGIDVSYAQGAVDWNAVKASGVEFAMIRASRGAVGTKPMAVDTTFDYNITQATAAGLKVGVYHYLYADTVSEAKKEAKFFLKTIAPYKITYPVVLDVEEQYQADLGKKKLTSIVKAFLDEVSAAGYYTMIYANKAWLTNYLDMSKLSDYDVWLAQWNTVPTYAGDFGMWQYSSKGIVSGINGYVDLNLSYKNYTKIIKEGNYNNLS